MLRLYEQLGEVQLLGLQTVNKTSIKKCSAPYFWYVTATNVCLLQRWFLKQREPTIQRTLREKKTIFRQVSLMLVGLKVAILSFLLQNLHKFGHVYFVYIWSLVSCVQTSFSRILWTTKCLIVEIPQDCSQPLRLSFCWTLEAHGGWLSRMAFV